MNENKSVPFGGFELKRFSKDVLIYSLGSGLILLLSFAKLAIIPKNMSVESYGYWQLFMLYTSYVAILNFGFINGTHVRWAGKDLDQVSTEIKIAFKFLLIEQLVLIIPMLILTYIIIQPPYTWTASMLLVYGFIFNLLGFFMWTCLAVKRFRLLTIFNVGKESLFFLLLILIFLTGFLDYRNIILIFLASNIIALSAFLILFRRYLWDSITALAHLLTFGWKNIKVGIFVLLGNFVLILFLTVDRLAISSFFAIEQFALYAFASNIVMVAFAFVSSISEVLFPYIPAALPELRTRIYQVGRPAIIISWAAILAVYFPIARLIEIYLPQYTASLSIIKLLLGTVGFISLIGILHVNYYKAYRKQQQYFLWGITALAITVLLVLLAIKILGTLESVAIAMFLSFVVWYIANELSLKAVIGKSSRETWRSLTVMVCYFAAFWLASRLTDQFVAQMLIYIGFFLLVTWLFFRNVVTELLVLANRNRNQRR